MPLRLRLQRHGRGKRPYYWIVAADSRVKRDGKFIEKLGTYNPTTVPAEIDLNSDSALEWLDKGAQPSDTVNAILKYRGVLYKKHLQRGVKKGAFTQEEADKMFAEFMEQREKSVLDHQTKVADTSGKAKADAIAAEKAKNEARAEARRKAAEEARAEAEAANAPAEEASEEETPAEGEAEEETPAAE